MTLTIVVFFGNLLLHALVMYLYHRFAIFRRLTPKFMKSGDGRIELKPVLSVSAANRQEFVEQGSKIREKYMVLTQDEINGHQAPKAYSRRTSTCSSVGLSGRRSDSTVNVNGDREESVTQI